MANESHINVTIDFTSWGYGGVHDLRIPVRITVKQLIVNLMEALNVYKKQDALCVIKVITKDILISNEDILSDYPIADGDIFKVM
ncbi:MULTISPECIES: EsaB/YukD family protein [Bacillaceae]|uniref:Uncharacterized protein n=1 Tax=Evansella alkalicola TaxID=745819 RepID=A0ABS6JY21_9BACI|nr:MULTISPECIES: EsaB/YukD family protein [Bacillaceae]MBU9723482.1 hypothetical protein [Bacillus alkalicola]